MENKARQSSQTAHSNLHLAVEEVKNGSKYIDAAEKYNVPLSILYTRLSAKRADSKNCNTTKRAKLKNSKNMGSRSPMQKALRAVKSGKGIKESALKYEVSKSALREKAKSFFKTNPEVGKKKRSVSDKKAPVCVFCNRPEWREEELGKFYILKQVAAHYYCLLFSSALEQKGNDDQGVLGFLAKDILKEYKRGTKLRCKYCSKPGATVGCSKKSCKMSYHFPCGLDKNAQFEFLDEFCSYCPEHRKNQKGKCLGEEVECPICCENFTANTNIAVWSPCCQPDSWFHKLCLRQLALSAGYFFKCPLCNDQNTFVKEMQRQSIFVPEKDASWELEPNAFQDLLERPIRCEAPTCLCSRGRKFDNPESEYEVVLCHSCGSTGVHLKCAGLQLNCTSWNCKDCSAFMASHELKKRPLSDGPLGQPSPKKPCIETGCSSITPIAEDGDDELPPFVASSTPTLTIDSLLKANQKLELEQNNIKNYKIRFMMKLKASNMSIKDFLKKVIKFRKGVGMIVSDHHIERFTKMTFNMDQMNVFRSFIDAYYDAKKAQNNRHYFVYRQKVDEETAQQYTQDHATKNKLFVRILNFIKNTLILEGNTIFDEQTRLKLTVTNTVVTKKRSFMDNFFSVGSSSTAPQNSISSRYSDEFEQTSLWFQTSTVRCRRMDLTLLKECFIPIPKNLDGSIVILDPAMGTLEPARKLVSKLWPTADDKQRKNLNKENVKNRLSSPKAIKTVQDFLDNSEIRVINGLETPSPLKKLQSLSDQLDISTVFTPKKPSVLRETNHLESPSLKSPEFPKKELVQKSIFSYFQCNDK